MQDSEENPEEPDTGDDSSPHNVDNDAANGDNDNDDHECNEDNVGQDNDTGEDRLQGDNDIKSENTYSNENSIHQEDGINNCENGSDTEIETKPDIDPSMFDDGWTQNRMDQGEEEEEEDIKSEVGSTCKDGEEEEEGDGVKLEIKADYLIFWIYCTNLETLSNNV